MAKTSELNILPVLSPKDVSKKVIEQVELERTGKQLGMLTRYPKLNIAFRKYFRFNQVNLFAGLSGSGKSLFLNILSEDFLDYREENSLNCNIDFIPILLHFCFEMSATNEMLRSIATDLGLSFDYLLSSARVDKQDGTKGYNKITDRELDVIKKILEKQSNKSILYFETSGNVAEVEHTINAYFNRYTKHAEAFNAQSFEKRKGKTLVYKFIINFDHTLLFEKFDEDTQLQIISNIAKMAIRVRKRGDAMINLIGQLNNNIEDIRRLTMPSLHYPQKSDIYAQGELYNACDTVAILHRPELLKISNYGLKQLPTKGLIHLLILKARFAKIGSIWFKEAFEQGTILALEENVEEQQESANFNEEN